MAEQKKSNIALDCSACTLIGLDFHSPAQIVLHLDPCAVGAGTRRYVRLDFAFVINLKQWFRQAASRLQNQGESSAIRGTARGGLRGRNTTRQGA